MKCRKKRRGTRRRSGAGTHSIKTSGEIALGGAIVGYGMRNFAKDNETLNKTHYARPLAAAVAGHLIRRKHPKLGDGMLGAAGFALALEYDDRTNRFKSNHSSDSLTGEPVGGDVDVIHAPPQQTLGNAQGWMDASGVAYPPGFRGYDAGAVQTISVPVPDWNAAGLWDDDAGDADDDDAGDADDDDAGGVVFPTAANLSGF